MRNLILFFCLPFLMSPLYAQDQEPSYPGGNGALLKWFNTYFIDFIDLPDYSFYHSRIYLRFMIDEYGCATDFKVLRSAYELGKTPKEIADFLDSSMPCWKPGLKDGVPTTSFYMLPIYINVR